MSPDAHRHARGSEDLRAFLRSHGEQLFTVGQGFTVTRPSRHLVGCEFNVFWDAAAGTLTLVTGLPIEVPPARRDAVARVLAELNAESQPGGFVLHDGLSWRAVVPLGHDGTLSTAAALRLLDAGTAAYERHLPALKLAAGAAP